MKDKQCYLYIMSNKNNTVLYIGATFDLIKRVYEHKNKFVSGFTEKYNVTKLVYFEVFYDIINAVTREKQMKKWKRAWKDELIIKKNPSWQDLYNDII